MKTIFKLLIVLIVLSSQALGQECFYPAHNLAGYSNDLTSATGWTRPATITDDSATTAPPPREYNVNKTFKAVLAASNRFVLYGANGNAYNITNDTYQITAYAKYGTVFPWLKLAVTGGTTHGCMFDIQNGTTGACSATKATTPTITAVSGGWYKISWIFTGDSTVAASFRLFFEVSSTNAFSTTGTPGGTEIVYLSSPQVQDTSGLSTDALNMYVPTTTFEKAWAAPKTCAADVFSSTVEGVYGATTMGGYIERIKNYVANKMTKSGSTYTIYKNDETTVYQTGTTSGAGRDPS